MKPCKFIVNPDTLDTTGMVSASQLMINMSCKRKWAFSYLQNLTPRVDRPYLTIGKLCHIGMQYAMRSWASTGEYTDGHLKAGLHAIEEEYNNYVSTNSFLEEEMEGIEHTYLDAKAVFAHAWSAFDYTRWAVYEVCNAEGKVIPALELHYVIPCTGSKGMHGYIDAILRERETGFLWCVDYKFRKALEDPEEEAFSIQNAIYTRACDRMGIGILGTLTWQHVNTPPAMPAVNKNGTISRAKIKTTWEAYSDACVLYGQNPDEYADEMKEKLADIEWCRETREYRNNLTISNIWNDVVVPAARMVHASYKRKNPPSMYPWNCKMCQFRDLCQAELRGHDVDGLIATSYCVRTSRVKKDIDTEEQPVV